jgi:hypothetical protein
VWVPIPGVPGQTPSPVLYTCDPFFPRTLVQQSPPPPPPKQSGISFAIQHAYFCGCAHEHTERQSATYPQATVMDVLVVTVSRSHHHHSVSSSGQGRRQGSTHITQAACFRPRRCLHASRHQINAPGSLLPTCTQLSAWPSLQELDSNNQAQCQGRFTQLLLSAC